MLNSPSFRGYPRWKELYLQEDAWGPLTKTYLEGGGLCNLGNAGVENCSPDDVELQVQGPQFLSLGAREAPRALPSLLPWCQKFALSWNEVSFWGFWDFKDFPNDAHMHPESRTSAPNKLGVTSTSSSLLLHYQGCKQKSYQVLMFLSGLHWQSSTWWRLGRPEGQVLPHTSMGARDRRLREPNRGMDSSTLLGGGPHSMSIHILSTQWMLARLKSGKNQEGF